MHSPRLDLTAAEEARRHRGVPAPTVIDKLTARPSAAGQAARAQAAAAAGHRAWRTCGRRGPAAEARTPAAPGHPQPPLRGQAHDRRRGRAQWAERRRLLVFRDAATERVSVLYQRRTAPRPDRARGLTAVSAARLRAGRPRQRRTPPRRPSRLPCASCSDREALQLGSLRARAGSTARSSSPACSGPAWPSPATPTTSATAACRSWAAARSATCASSPPAGAARDPGAPGPLPHLLLRRHQGPGAAAGAAGRRPSARGIPVLVTPAESTPFIKHALRLPGRAAGPAPAPALGADGRLRPGRAHRGGERHRQVGVRAGPHRPRPPPGGGRRGGDQAHGATRWSAPPRTSRATTWSCAAWA